MKRQIIEHSLREANDALADFLASPRTLPTMEAIVDTMAEALRNGCKIMSCGNGGSLCDATHFAEELTGRFRENRRPLAAMAINDPAYMTCVGNDFSFGDISSAGSKRSANPAMSCWPSRPAAIRRISLPRPRPPAVWG